MGLGLELALGLELRLGLGLDRGLELVSKLGRLPFMDDRIPYD